MIKLDIRLGTIASLVGQCRFFADIGADHGRLSAYLLQKGICQNAQLVDISAPSLEKARALIDRLGLHDRADIICANGARALTQKPDCAVIAGMGGPTIADIVVEGADVLEGSLIITQPNVGIYDMRKRLSSAGWAIVDERLAFSSGRWYVIIAWRGGEARYNDMELMAGPVLLKRGGEDFKAYAAFRISIAEVALQVERACDDEPTIAMRRELSLWREVEKNL